VPQKENSEHEGPTEENETQLEYAQRNQEAKKQRKTQARRMMNMETTIETGKRKTK